MKKLFYSILCLSAIIFTTTSFKSATPILMEDVSCGIGMQATCADGSSIAFSAYGRNCAAAYAYGNATIAAFCSDKGGVTEL